MNTREEFEKWAKSENYHPRFFRTLTNGVYADVEFRNMFDTWQACQALNDKRIAELEEKLRVAEVDAKRYQRARLIGCAVLGTLALKNGTVERFQSLDLTIDNDIAKYPTRGEAREALKTIEG